MLGGKQPFRSGRLLPDLSSEQKESRPKGLKKSRALLNALLRGLKCKARGQVRHWPMARARALRLRCLAHEAPQQVFRELGGLKTARTRPPDGTLGVEKACSVLRLQHRPAKSRGPAATPCLDTRRASSVCDANPSLVPSPSRAQHGALNSARLTNGLPVDHLSHCFGFSQLLCSHQCVPADTRR